MKVQMNHIDICFESRFSVEQLETIHRVAPDSMVLIEGDLEQFVIYSCSEPEEAEIDEYGIGFYMNSLITGKAVLHCPYPKSVLDKINIDKIGTEECLATMRDEVAAFIGSRLSYMNQIEDQMQKALDEYNNSVESVKNKIEIPVVGITSPNILATSYFNDIEVGV